MRPTFRQLCQDNAAIAIKALIDSLNNQNRIPWLTLQCGSTARNVRDGICYGCPATYTIINLVYREAPVEPIKPNIFGNAIKFGKYLKCDFEDLRQFDNAIDRFGRGKISHLTAYFDTDLPYPSKSWLLDWDKPVEDLPIIQNYYDQLISSRSLV